MVPGSPVSGRRLLRLSLALSLATLPLHACLCTDDSFSNLVPVMRVDPESIDLEGVPVAQDTDFTIEISNPSNVTLESIEVKLREDSDPNIEIISAPEEVEPREPEKIRLRVRPQVTGIIGGILEIKAEPGAEPNFIEVPITIEAVDLGLPEIVIDPTAVDFGTLSPGSVATATITVSNVGVRDLIIDETLLVPDVEGDMNFALVTPVQPGWAVPPNQSVEVTVNYRPEDLGPRCTDLAVRSNDPERPLVASRLCGFGAVCPDAVAMLLDNPDEIEPLDTIRFDGAGSFANTEGTDIEVYEWELAIRPIGSTTVLTAPDEERTELTTDLAGDYEIRLSVYDTEGIKSCEDSVVRVTAQPTEQLHLQLVWDHPYADLDLHLLREGGEYFDHNGDTYFSNRTPEWFSEFPLSNPHLDADDDDGYGPENINVTEPIANSTWTVGVHYWNKQTDGDPYLNATLRVYAWGQLVSEIYQPFEEDEMMWTAIEIEWPDELGAPPGITVLNQIEEFPRPF